MSTIKNIDIDLIKKYDRPGPRYTSYPPAPAFSSSFTADDFLQSLKENNTPADNYGDCRFIITSRSATRSVISAAAIC